MKTIALKEAFEILKECSAVIINDDILVYPSLDDVIDDDNNEFMQLAFADWEGDLDLVFMEGNNKIVTISGSSMFLYEKNDEIDNPTQITILGPKNIE
jgi:hypothetical protein